MNAFLDKGCELKSELVDFALKVHPCPDTEAISPKSEQKNAHRNCKFAGFGFVACAVARTGDKRPERDGYHRLAGLTPTAFKHG